MIKIEKKKISESQVTLSQVMQPQHANPAQNVFGGVIMSIIDNAALITASRNTHKNCVTASVDRLDFLSPVYVGNVVFAKASINYASTTSMEIGVRVEAECLVTGRSAHVGSAYLTYVALDDNDNPTEVPQLILETEEEKRLFGDAKKRREQRLRKIRKETPQSPCMVRVNDHEHYIDNNFRKFQLISKK